ncbi:MAG TPA: hypothetical protein VHH88_11275, partial [Verrucomicrobiae bacterium]|nr:hypothetical protein [Verrucomicrobiae bacterium]
KLKTGWQASPEDELFAPVLVVSPAFSAQIEKHPGYVMTGFYALRPRVFLMLYVRAELWDRYLASVSK